MNMDEAARRLHLSRSCVHWRIMKGYIQASYVPYAHGGKRLDIAESEVERILSAPPKPVPSMQSPAPMQKSPSSKMPRPSPAERGFADGIAYARSGRAADLGAYALLAPKARRIYDAAWEQGFASGMARFR